MIIQAVNCYLGSSGSGAETGTGDLVSLWAGALTDDTLTASVVVTSDSDVRLAVSASSDLSSPTLSGIVASANNVAKITISGLSPDTPYYFGARIGGVLDTGTVGQFRTLPSSSAFSFKCAFAGDAATNSNAVTFDAIRAKSPRFFIHLGDMHYSDIDTDDPSLFRAAYDAVFAQAKQHQLYREVPTLYMPDDHDGPDNDMGAASTAAPAWMDTYRERVPHFPLVENSSGDPLYHAFDVGRVKFIMTDLRSAASAIGDTDNSSKTMMGTTQKTWFKNLLSDSANDEKFFVWISPRLFGGVPTAGADHWGGFTTERTELADHIQSNCLGRIAVLSADMHGLAIDDGTNHDFATSGDAPIPTFQAAPLDKTDFTDYGGATYSEIHSELNYQFGEMEVTDDGGGGIRIDWRGYQGASGDQIVHYWFAADLTGALDLFGEPVTTAREDAPYDGFTLVPTGGTPPYTFSVHSGSLPAGLSLNASTGAVTGTPTTAGTSSNIVLRVTDDVSATADLAAFDIEVDVPLVGWEEIGRQESLSSGKLVLSGLNTDGLSAIRILILGVTATSDDTYIKARFHVGGSEVSAGYRWGAAGTSSSAGTAIGGDESDDGFQLSLNPADTTNWGVGNASTKSFQAELTVDDPGSTTLYKKVYRDGLMLGPTGNIGKTFGAGLLENTGAIEGITVFGTSNLTGGKIIVLGLQ